MYKHQLLAITMLVFSYFSSQAFASSINFNELQPFTPSVIADNSHPEDAADAANELEQINVF